MGELDLGRYKLSDTGDGEIQIIDTQTGDTVTMTGDGIDPISATGGQPYGTGTALTTGRVPSTEYAFEWAAKGMHDGVMYALGGDSSHPSGWNGVWKWDFLNDTHTQSEGPLPTLAGAAVPHSPYTAAEVGSEIWMLGGYDGDFNYTAATGIYDMETETFDDSIANLPVAAEVGGTVYDSLNGYVWVIGQGDVVDNMAGSLIRYDVDTKTQDTSPTDLGTLDGYSRENVPVAFDPTVGASGTLYYLRNDLHAYDIDTDTWSQVGTPGVDASNTVYVYTQSVDSGEMMIYWWGGNYKTRGISVESGSTQTLDNHTGIHEFAYSGSGGYYLPERNVFIIPDAWKGDVAVIPVDLYSFEQPPVGFTEEVKSGVKILTSGTETTVDVADIPTGGVGAVVGLSYNGTPSDSTPFINSTQQEPGAVNWWLSKEADRSITLHMNNNAGESVYAQYFIGEL